MKSDIFQFWKEIKRHEKIYPKDQKVFDRVGRQGHGLNLRCLPANFAGKLKAAPVVLLFLSPGFSPGDLIDAATAKGRAEYAKRRTGKHPLSEEWTGYKWFISRTKAFALDFSVTKHKIAILNIGAYHSKRFGDYPLLAALPSSRVALDWAQNVLFPQAIKGERVVVCLRAAHFWGLEAGKKHGKSLFAPEVTIGGHMRKKSRAERQMRAAIIHAVRQAIRAH